MTKIIANDQSALHNVSDLRGQALMLILRWNMARTIVAIAALAFFLLLVGCTSPAPQVKEVERQVTVLVPQTVAVRETAVVRETVVVRETIEVPVTVVVTSTPEPTATPLPTPEADTSIPSRGTYNHKYEITEQYDRFKDETTVLANPDTKKVVLGQPDLSVGYTYKGTSPSRPDTVSLVRWTVSDEWQYLDCYDFTLLVDDSRMKLKSEHEGEVLSGGSVLEMVLGTMTVDDFLSIVNAGKIEGQVCNTEFTFGNEQMEMLRDAASRMQP